jgi:dienelactone hydrolase
MPTWQSKFTAVVRLLTLGLSLTASLAWGQEKPRVLVPQGAGPFPVVLLVSGCSGLTSFNGVNVYEERAHDLVDAGYVTVFVDYLGKRGLNTCRYTINVWTAGSDAIEAANWVRTQPDVDPSRVYAIGWSFGGGALLSALSRLGETDLTLTKAVAISPLCQGAKPWVAATPLLLLLGALDDVAPPVYCNPLISDSKPGKVTVLVFPNARHGFDLRSLPESTPYSSGGTLGYNAQADQAAKREIAEFLR